MKTYPISIIGLGKLGLPLALCFAANGESILGYDVNHKTISSLKALHSPIMEPNAQEMLKKYNRRMRFITDPKLVIEESDVSYIIVPTPSKEDGSFSSLYIEQAIEALTPYLRNKKEKHTFVITSTVSPGTMEKRILPLLEKGTGKRVGKEIGLCYSPELIALGSVVENITKPDFIFIGESDETTGNLVEKLRSRICANNPKVIRTNWINVELAKLALNAYITTKISFANMVARIAERTQGADSGIILNMIGQDSRVGTKYLKGGLGFGGPCFPRDNRSLYSVIKKLGLDIQLPLNTDVFNRKQVDFLYQTIKRHYKKGQRIGILGLSYKPETDVTDESQGMLLAQLLKRKRVKVHVYDPSVKKGATGILHENTQNECIVSADIIVITTSWNQFKEIDWDMYKGKIIVDCWRQINTSKFDGKRNTFIQLGTYIKSP